MTPELYLIDHDQNVKGGILWWIPLIIILLLLSFIITRIDEKVVPYSNIKSEIRKEPLKNSLQKSDIGFGSNSTKTNKHIKD